MKMPVLFLGSTLIFWGWQTGLLVVAVLMALALESPRLINMRWGLSDGDFKRITDLCTVIFVVLLIYLLAADRPTNFILDLLQWLPMVLFPLIVAQFYSTKGRVNLNALFLLLRKQKSKDKRPEQRMLDLSFPYSAICLLSAGAANDRSIYYYASLMVFAGILLWLTRSKRFSPVMWLCLLIIAGTAGYGGHIGLHRLQIAIENKGLELFSNFNRTDPDPFQTRTAIGDVGTLKPSNRIVFRVAADKDLHVPILLKASVYNNYLFSTWYASNSQFIPMDASGNGRSWKMRNGSDRAEKIIVSSYLNKGKGLLKLPDNAFQVGQLSVTRFEINSLGTARVEGGPTLANYSVLFDDKITPHGPPDKSDLQIPQKEMPAVHKIVKEIGLIGKTSQEVVRTLQSFFDDHFEYSLIQSKGDVKSTPISDFLLRTRSGHCEYFATATVLLLRAAGIPARYAKGYSLHEYSNLEKKFVVRDRHAHAWCQAYLDGAWRNLDTTSSSWSQLETEAASKWGILSDAWSFVKFKLINLWMQAKAHNLLKHVWWLVIPLIYIPLRKIRLNKKKKLLKSEDSDPVDSVVKPLGSDSEFYLITEILDQTDFGRQSSETLSDWIERLITLHPQADLIEALKPILALHCRYRFDPLGITPAERLTLKKDAHSWLDRFQSL